MPLNFPSSPVNGQNYTDANAVVWEFDGVKWNVISGTRSKMFSGAKIKLSSEYNLTSSNTVIQFNDEVIDTDSYYDVSKPTRVTVGKDAFYRINFSIYSGTNGSSYTIVLKKNGTTNLSTVVIAPNQYTNYDEIVQLNGGDYIELYASETNSVGTLLTTTTLEVTRVGLPLGSSISSAELLSGVRGILTNDYSTTNNSTALAWNSTAFNQNANAAGNTYWTVTEASKFTIQTTGYYRIKSVISIGSTDSCTINLRQNNVTTISSATVQPNGYAQIDEIIKLNQNDYLELYIKDENSTGTIQSESYFEVIRTGI